MINKIKFVLAVIVLTVLTGHSGVMVFAQAQPIGNQPPPAEPYISISPDSFNTLEEILYIEGRSDPSAIVTVLLEQQGKQPVKFTVRADSSGEWVVAEKTYLSAGNWEVRARQQVGSLLSGWSNPRVIQSVVNGVDIFGFKIRYVVIAVIVFIFLAILGSVFFYFRKKIQRLQRGLIEKQLKETEDRFHRGFEEIRKDLMDQLKDLALNAQTRALTPDEVEKRDHVLRELEQLERNLDHDIGDIGKKY